MLHNRSFDILWLEFRAQNEEDVSAQLAGFLEQFLDVFSELKGKNFYLTGESVSSSFVVIVRSH